MEETLTVTGLTAIVLHDAAFITISFLFVGGEVLQPQNCRG